MEYRIENLDFEMTTMQDCFYFNILFGDVQLSISQKG
jgi:hypothetical protein